MLFAKGELIMDVNPAFENLYLRQGWTPYVDEPKHEWDVEGTEEPVDSIPELITENKIYKKGDFTTMSKDAILELAKSLGYTITAEKKADMIEEFLSQQN